MQDKKFKSRLGFDSNNETITNVGNPKTPSDAINLGYYTEFNSVLLYQEDRGYVKDFIVNYNGKLYTSKNEIRNPSGKFNYRLWEPVKNSPVWSRLDSKTASNFNLLVGSYYAVNTIDQTNTVTLNLPSEAFEGDTIHIMDTGYNLGYSNLQIKSSLKNIKSYDKFKDSIANKDNVDNLILTKPGTYIMLYYVSGLWEYYTHTDEEFATKTLTSLKVGETSYKTQSWEHIYDNLQTQTVISLPKYAIYGDRIKYSKISNGNFISFKTFDDSTKIIYGSSSYEEIELQTNSDIVLTFNGESWIVSKPKRERILRKLENLKTDSTTVINPNEDIFIIENENITKNLVYTLPRITPLESSIINLYFLTGKDVNVTLTNDLGNIVSNSNTLLLNEYGKGNESLKFVPNKDLKFNPSTNRIIGLTLLSSGTDWSIVDIRYKTYITDPKNIDQAGVIKLVSETEMLSNVMTSDNRAITPFLLEKRIPSETRKGIIELATQDETLKGIDDVRAVTPKKLLNTIAKEDQRGLSFVAKQTEVDAGTDHTKFVTPKTLDSKLPNMNGKRGVVSLVNKGGITGKDRFSSGTHIFNHDDTKLVVTPSTLHEVIASENNWGFVGVATETEVLEGTNVNIPTIVTPANLHKRTATLSRTGLIQLASLNQTREGKIDNMAVTPSTLLNTIATEGQRGLSFVAKQSEVDVGTDHTKFVTSKTLDSKLPNMTGKKGVVSLVNKGGVAPTKRGGEDGTLIYNHKDSTLVVTPSTLHELISTENVLGLSVKATETEVLNGSSTLKHTYVSPEYLHKRTSTLTRTGLVKMATDVDMNFKDVNFGKVDNIAISPKALHDLTPNFDRRGIVKLSTDAEAKTGTDITSAIPPRTLRNTLRTLSTVKSNVSNIKINGNAFDGYSFEYINDHDTPISFKNLNSGNGYVFRIINFKDSPDLLKTLTPPPSNKVGVDIVNANGTVTHNTNGTAKYEGEYLYERYAKSTTIFERITIEDKVYIRNTYMSGTNKVTKGWSTVYNSFNKPTPVEINAIDKSDIVVGRVQVEDYLDIIVDSKNRVRIEPNKDTNKVSVVWIKE